MFFKKLSNFLKDHKDNDRLSKLFADILLGYELAKTMKIDLISSEGLAQRLLSISLRKKILKRNLRKLCSYLPNPSHIIYFVKDKQTNISIYEIVKVYRLQNVKLITLKEHDQEFHKIFYKISKILK